MRGDEGNELIQRAASDYSHEQLYYPCVGAQGLGGNDLIQNLGFGGWIDGGTGNALLIGGVGGGRFLLPSGRAESGARYRSR